MVTWKWGAWLWLTFSAATLVPAQALMEEKVQHIVVPQHEQEQPCTQQQLPAHTFTLQSQPAPKDGELKRASFNPWGSKHSDSIFPAVLTYDFLNKPTNRRNLLVPWAGKLATGYIVGDASPQILKGNLTPYITILSEAGKPYAAKQESFATWGNNQGSHTPDSGNEEIWTEDEPSNLFLVDENLPIAAVNHMRYKREAESRSYAEVPVKREDLHDKASPAEDESSNPVSKDAQSRVDIPIEAKRVRFSAWAGKRLDLQAIQNVVRKWMEHKPRMAERRAFNAWAGKRSDRSLEHIEDKRKFSAWAGKRFNDDTNQHSLMKKTRFSAWAGKRSEEITPEETSTIIWTSTDGSSQRGTNDDLKRTFNAWAGKRSNNDDKRHAFNAWAGKRSDTDDKQQSFSAWASKQSNNDDKQQPLNPWADKRSNTEEKRQAFNAWAGKRSNSDEKRQAFSAWAGKRSNNDEKRQAFSAWAGKRSNDDEKRQAFNAWAGKRSNSDEKRQAFNAWAGKRSNNDEKRQAFNAWAGKRSNNDDKRQAFSAWAGKRSNDDDKRQAFNAWAGKRSNNDDKRQAFNAWAGKRSNNNGKRQAFNAWAGKRSNNDVWAGEQSNVNDEQHAFSAWADNQRAFNAWAGMQNNNDKRQSFSAWAGKRSKADEKEVFNSWASRRDLQREDEIDIRPERRPTFGAWVGKRNNRWQYEGNSQEISDILQHLHKQGQELFHKKAYINSWGGKWVPFSNWEGKKSNLVSGDSQLTDLVLTQL
ncbi:uncharacterized protein [Panulirus ornatus]|uniref:uncharacterized protein n=1 Tax=Panulirus ornatus TaxID=150431 RepID=UPI003A8ABC6E